jgi:hypothetical protein
MPNVKTSSLEDRIYCGIEIVTLVTCAAFTDIVLFDLNNPSDDGSCLQYTNEISCLNRKTPLDSTQSYCAWSNPGSTNGVCSFAEIEFSRRAIAYVFMITTIITALCETPLIILIEIVRSPSINEETGQGQKFSPDELNRTLEVSIKQKALNISNTFQTCTFQTCAEKVINCSRSWMNELVTIFSVTFEYLNAGCVYVMEALYLRPKYKKYKTSASVYKKPLVDPIKRKRHGIARRYLPIDVPVVRSMTNQSFMQVVARYSNDELVSEKAALAIALERETYMFAGLLSNNESFAKSQRFQNEESMNRLDLENPCKGYLQQSTTSNQQMHSEKSINESKVESPHEKYLKEQVQQLCNNVVTLRERVSTFCNHAMLTQEEVLQLYDQQWNICKAAQQNTKCIGDKQEKEDGAQPQLHPTFDELTIESFLQTFEMISEQVRRSIEEEQFLQFSNEDAGLELLHSFLIDLLGYKTKAAKIFRNKFDQDFRKRQHMPAYKRWWNYCRLEWLLYLLCSFERLH